MAQEQSETALGAAGATGQGNRGAEQLHKGAGSHDREKVDLVVAKGEHQEVRNQIEECQLQHGDDDREQHGRKMAGRELELLGERVDLAIDKRAPALDLGGRDTHALEPIDDAVRDARDGLGHKRDGKDAEQNAAVAAKAKDAQERHIAIALGEKRHAGEQQNGAPGNEAKLIHDKAGELRGSGLANVLAGFGQAVDLGRRGTHHHGRQVAKEDAARLDRDEVANTDGRIGIEPHSDRVGHDAKNQIQEHAKARDKKPRHLNARHGGPELPHLTGHNQIDDIAHQHDADENSAAACALVVIAARDLNLDLGLGCMLRGLRHVAPSNRQNIFDIVPVRATSRT